MLDREWWCSLLKGRMTVNDALRTGRGVLMNNLSRSDGRMSQKHGVDLPSAPRSPLWPFLFLWRSVSWYSAAALMQLRLSYLNLHSVRERDRAGESERGIDNAGHSPMTTLKGNWGEESGGLLKSIIWISVLSWVRGTRADFISSLLWTLLYIWCFIGLQWLSCLLQRSWEHLALMNQ